MVTVWLLSSWMISFVTLGHQIIHPNVYHSLCLHIFWPTEIFSFLYAFGSELQDIFIFLLFHFPFFQMVLFRCWALPLQYLQSAVKCYWHWNSYVIREWSCRNTRINICICASFDDAFSFPALLAPRSKPGNENWVLMPDRWDLPWGELLDSKIFYWELEGRISK